MIWTNKHGLSEEIYEAIVARQSQYDLTRDGYSATTLIGAPRQAHLMKRHHEEAEQDVYDMYDSFMGHILHDVLEKDETSQRIMTKEFGPEVHGAYDYYKDGVLKDYKRTGTYAVTVKDEETMDKWTKQINIYAYLLRDVLGEDVKEAYVEVFLKDWSPMKAETERNYPRAKQYKVYIPLWDMADQWTYIASRVDALESYKDAADEDLPLCTLKEKWQDPLKFAVKKKGGKRALRVLDSEDAALQYIYDKYPESTEHYIEERPSIPRLCPQCAVRKFCNQYEEE